MFIGHFAVGFGAKAVAPRPSLGTLFLAAQFIDLLWPTLLVFGVERVRIVPGITAMTPFDFEYYPISHSLLAVILWAAGFGLVYFFLRRDRRAAWVLAAAVLSHWLLDAVVHRPDLPLYPGGEARVGFDLWSSIPVTLVLESTLFAAGVWLYARTTTATDRTGRWALWGLIVFLAAMYLATVLSGPPPSVAAIAWGGHAQWLLVAWGYWVDRHRRVVHRAERSGT